MDVLCIDNKRRGYSAYDPAQYLVEGHVYTVVDKDTAMCKETGIVVAGYVLAGMDPYYVFAEDRFVPTSDLDETTLVNEEFEEKYCVPVNQKL